MEKTEQRRGLYAKDARQVSDRWGGRENARHNWEEAVTETGRGKKKIGRIREHLLLGGTWEGHAQMHVQDLSGDDRTANERECVVAIQESTSRWRGDHGVGRRDTKR